MTFLLLLACTGKTPEDSTAPVDTGGTFAPPTIAVVAPMEYGQLRSTCQLTLDVYAEGDTSTPLNTLTYNARGGDWAGAPVDAGVQYQAIGSWNDCINTGDVTGTFESTAFSLEEGGLFVFWYAGTLGGFDTLVQGTNYVGGTGVLTYEAGTAPVLPGDVTGTDGGDGTWTIAYDSAIPFPNELAQFAAQEGYVMAEPDWLLYRPDWWQIQ
jgi:hypothetical protein